MNLGIVKHIFISTEEMEKSNKNKSQTLAKTLCLKEEDYRTIIIDQNNPIKILSELKENIDLESGFDFVVNITGGTKMMSQMTHKFFAQFDNVKIYYWPIGAGYVEQLYPEYKSIEFPTGKIELDLKTYLAAYGYSFTKASTLSHSYRLSDSLMSKAVALQNAHDVPEIKKAKAQTYTRDDKSYLMGGWFEEWIYNTIKDHLGLDRNQIGFNLKLKNEYSKRQSESDNEIDVAFVYKNSLNIIECKVYSPYSKNLGKNISDTIYKISSVRQSLGLRANAYVALLAPLGQSKNRKKSIQTTLKMAMVERLFAMENLANKNEFIKHFKN